MTENTETKTEETQEEKQQERTEAENLFHKLYLFGLGVQKDVEETVKSLIEKGGEKAEEREKIIDDFVKKAKESSSTVEKRLEEFVNRALESMNLVSIDKYEELEERVQVLEQKLQELKPE